MTCRKASSFTYLSLTTFIITDESYSDTQRPNTLLLFDVKRPTDYPNRNLWDAYNGAINLSECRE